MYKSSETEKTTTFFGPLAQYKAQAHTATITQALEYYYKIIYPGVSNRAVMQVVEHVGH